MNRGGYERRLEQRRETPGCPVCIDGQGFFARPCPGCTRQKLRTPSGLVLGLPPRARREYLALQRALNGGGEEAHE